jgi:acyl-CoA synthetase (NDP forming)
MRGLSVEAPSAATLARLAAAGVAVKPARLVDLTITGTRYESMKAALDVMLAAPEFDLVLAVVGSSARAQPQATVRPIIDSAVAGKPLAAFLVPEAPDALAMLSAAGVPCFRTPEACADAVAAALSRRAPSLPLVPAQAETETFSVPHDRTGFPLARERTEEAAERQPDEGESVHLLDELAAGELLDRLGIARAPAVALDAGIEQAPPLPFPYPVAVKVLSAAIAHKTDAGGVMLGVADGAALLAAIRQIRANIAERRPGVRVERVLVQPMLAGLGEALVGYRVDRDVGPLVLVAAGGVLAEVARDRSIRLAPVALAGAHDMLAELRWLVPLSGYRGRPRGDLDALAHAIVALSQLAHDPSVAEAEINPLIVRERGAVAVDALVRLA